MPIAICALSFLSMAACDGSAACADSASTTLRRVAFSSSVSGMWSPSQPTISPSEWIVPPQ